MPALYGGLITAGISTVPGLNLLNCFCCAGILLGGFLAVFFYRDLIVPETEPLTINDCYRLGALTGVVASLAGTIISILIMLMFGNIAAEIMVKIFAKMNLEFPPELQRTLDEALQSEMTVMGILFSFFFTLVLDIIFSILGALIGWSVFKPKVMPPAGV
jgi:hypothetical protein